VVDEDYTLRRLALAAARLDEADAGANTHVRDGGVDRILRVRGRCEYGSYDRHRGDANELRT